MTTKKAVVISAGVIVLIMVITFGISNVIANQNNASQVDVDLVSKIAEREASYRLLLEEANQRIDSLNAQLQASPEASVITENSADTNNTENQSVLTADAALDIAYQSVGKNEVLSGVPQLVSFQGTPAFEIPFVDGMMYIDAASGSILSSSVLTQITEEQAIAAVAEYLNITNTSNAVVKKYNIDGTDIFKVFINNYVLFVDKYGTITKFQIVKSSSSGGSSSSSSGSSGEGDEHGDDD
jgi:hypothetical protein